MLLKYILAICILIIGFSARSNSLTDKPLSAIQDTTQKYGVFLNPKNHRVQEIVFGNDSNLHQQSFLNGKLYRVRIFEDEEKLSKEFFFLKNGRLSEVRYYKDGKLSGNNVVFRNSGKIRIVYKYIDGILEDYIKFTSKGEPIGDENIIIDIPGVNYLD